MKNTNLSTFILLCGGLLLSCSKNNGPGSGNPQSSFSFSAGDSVISFPVNKAYIQDIYAVHTTLIMGQNPDTTAQPGSISIRVIGDTTGRFGGDSLFVAYTSPSGSIYYNTRDSTNFVHIAQFPKTYNGLVRGDFSVRVTNISGSLLLSSGRFSVFYQN